MTPKTAYLCFKDVTIHQKAKAGFVITTEWPLVDPIHVQINDLSKDTWQLPLIGVLPFTNPKVKVLTQEEFDKTFEVISVYDPEEKITNNNKV